MYNKTEPVKIDTEQKLMRYIKWWTLTISRCLWIDTSKLNTKIFLARRKGEHNHFEFKGRNKFSQCDLGDFEQDFCFLVLMDLCKVIAFGII